MHPPSLSATRAAIALLALGIGCGDDRLVRDDLGEAAYCEHLAITTLVSSDLEEDLFAAVNEARRVGARCGAQDWVPALPLTMIPELRCAARAHARDLAARGLLVHEGKSGETALDRTTRAGYDGLVRQELLAGDFRDPELVVAAWLADETHCRAIMEPRLQHAGTGHAIGDDGADIVWVLVTAEPF